MRPYTRSLDPADYVFLPHASRIRAFEAAMTAPHCVSHEHKLWENASIMQQLEELRVPKHARLLDVGSGGMFFPPYLATEGGYADLSLTDSNIGIAVQIEAQRVAYDIALPFYALPAEHMASLPTDEWDVVMCISAIEHMADHDAALREIWRLTKPGGFIFLTSDYFRSVDGRADPQQYAASPYRACQVTPYCKELVLNIPNVIAADFVGETDLDYCGDFVHNYSFCNVCLRKRQHPLNATFVANGGRMETL